MIDVSCCDCCLVCCGLVILTSVFACAVLYSATKLIIRRRQMFAEPTAVCCSPRNGAHRRDISASFSEASRHSARQSGARELRSIVFASEEPHYCFVPFSPNMLVACSYYPPATAKCCGGAGLLVWFQLVPSMCHGSWVTCDSKASSESEDSSPANKYLKAGVSECTCQTLSSPTDSSSSSRTWNARLRVFPGQVQVSHCTSDDAPCGRTQAQYNCLSTD